MISCKTTAPQGNKKRHETRMLTNTKENHSDKVREAFVGVRHPSAAVQEAFVGIRRSLAAVRDTFVGVRRSLAAVRDAFVGIRRSLAAMRDTFVGVRYFAVECLCAFADIERIRNPHADAGTLSISEGISLL
jgi:hypothetical protein